MWTPSPASKTMSQQELDALVERQMLSASQQRERRAQLERRAYPTAPGKRLSSEALEASCTRQYEYAKRKAEELERLRAKHATPPPKAAQLTSEDLGAFAERMQNGATAAQQRRKIAIAAAQKQREDEAKTVEHGRKLTKDDVKAIGARLCTPKKPLTYEQQQAVSLGQKSGVKLPEEWVAKAKRLEEQEEAARRARFKKQEQ